LVDAHQQELTISSWKEKRNTVVKKKKKIQPNIHANKRYARAGDVPVGESLCGHVDDFLLSSDAAITSS
jgi:hypothetical protein